MAQLKRGVEAGVKAQIVDLVIILGLGLLVLRTFFGIEGAGSLILSFLTALPTLILGSVGLSVGTGIIMLGGMVFFLLLQGIIQGIIFALLYGYFPGRSSTVKGVIYGAIISIPTFIAFGNIMFGVLISNVIFGLLLGFFW